MGELQPERRGRLGASRAGIVGALLLAGLAASTGGCTRKFFRQRADCEVDRVLADKDRYPAWKIEGEHVYPDPRARFADPTNPDRPPMPPDDSAAQCLSPNPQKPGKAGIAKIEGNGYQELLAAWDAQNRAEDDRDSSANQKREQTEPLAELDKADQPKNLATPRGFRIRLEQAAELGVINSREYQDRREDLYLAALPVTLERFAFAPQFFAAGQAARKWIGSEAPGGPANNWTLNGDVGVTKMFATGALLLFSIANQTVVNLTGTGPHTVSESHLTLDLIQPLLRGGGRAVTLEPLTQSERNLLYEIRNYAHFRKEFFTFIVGGADLTPSAVTFGSAVNAVTPGIIPGITGVSTDRIASLVNAGPAGRFAILAAALAPSAGYLPTLLPAAQLVNDRSNVTQLRALRKLFEAFKEGGDISQLQVDQVEQQLLQGESQVLQDELNYGNLLDQLKLQLGVPTDTALDLDDAPVRPLMTQFQRYSDIFAQFEAARERAIGQAPPDRAADVRPRLRELFTSSALVSGTRFRQSIAAAWAEWERRSDADLDASLQRLGDERRRLLDRRAAAEEAGRKLSDPDQARLAELDAAIDLGTFERILRYYEGEPWKGQPDPERRQRQRNSVFQFVVNNFSLVIGQARNERLEQLRTSWPDLPRLCVEGVNLLTADPLEAQAKVAQTALTNRLDLMNERARLVDAWRQIAVFANALMGVLNVEYRLDSFTPAGQAKPFAFGGSRNSNQLIFNGELPLVRLAERNNYRAALIAYQRERRALMEAEDVAVEQVRADLRQLRVLAENYKIQQRQVELAYLTVESSLDTFRAPPQPTPQGVTTPTTSTAVSAASLTQQLLSAQSSLPRAQNALLSVWISYLITRLDLYRDLELMQIDSRGVWIDECPACPGPAQTPGQPAEILGEPTPVSGD